MWNCLLLKNTNCYVSARIFCVTQEKILLNCSLAGPQQSRSIGPKANASVVSATWGIWSPYPETSHHSPIFLAWLPALLSSHRPWTSQLLFLCVFQYQGQVLPDISSHPSVGFEQGKWIRSRAHFVWSSEPVSPSYFFATMRNHGAVELSLRAWLPNVAPRRRISQEIQPHRRLPARSTSRRWSWCLIYTGKPSEIAGGSADAQLTLRTRWAKIVRFSCPATTLFSSERGSASVLVKACCSYLQMWKRDIVSFWVLIAHETSRWSWLRLRLTSHRFQALAPSPIDHVCIFTVDVGFHELRCKRRDAVFFQGRFTFAVQSHAIAVIKPLPWPGVFGIGLRNRLLDGGRKTRTWYYGSGMRLLLRLERKKSLPKARGLIRSSFPRDGMSQQHCEYFS